MKNLSNFCMEHVFPVVLTMLLIFFVALIPTVLYLTYVGQKDYCEKHYPNDYTACMYTSNFNQTKLKLEEIK